MLRQLAYYLLVLWYLWSLSRCWPLRSRSQYFGVPTGICCVHSHRHSTLPVAASVVAELLMVLDFGRVINLT